MRWSRVVRGGTAARGLYASDAAPKMRVKWSGNGGAGCRERRLTRARSDRGEVDGRTTGAGERAGGGVTTTAGTRARRCRGSSASRTAHASRSCPRPRASTRRSATCPTACSVRTQARGQPRRDRSSSSTRRAELARRFPSFARAIEPDGGLWVAWPKKTSGVATDLVFEVVQDIGLDHGLVDNKVARSTRRGRAFVSSTASPIADRLQRLSAERVERTACADGS